MAAFVTLRGGTLHVRPLYDGPITAGPYQWINPPPVLAKHNVVPQPGAAPVLWTDDGNQADSPSAPDGQALVSFNANAIAAKPGVTGVDVQFTPLDPIQPPLPTALPSGLRADGNAYKITVQYAPTGEPISSFGKQPVVFLQWATNGTAMLYSPDGTQWQQLKQGFHAGLPKDAKMSAQFAGNGYYLAASHGPLLPPAPKGIPLATIIIGALIIVPIIGIVWFVFPRRRAA